MNRRARTRTSVGLVRTKEDDTSNVRRSPRAARAHRERAGNCPFEGGRVPPLPGRVRQPCDTDGEAGRRTRSQALWTPPHLVSSR